VTAPLPNAAVLLGRGHGSENSDMVISHRYDFALAKRTHGVGRSVNLRSNM
jgi:hypothetical protein